MKRFLPLLLINSLVVGLIVFLASCEGPQGPVGPAGANGTDGLNGKDASQFCKVCHNSTKQSAIASEWATSLHATGESFATEGTRTSCAACHSSQGYLETNITGLDTMAITQTKGAMPVGCNTCHDFHVSLDSAEFPDYALSLTKGIFLRLNKTQYVDLKNSNVCMKCHQPRLPNPKPSGMNGTDSITISSSTWGVHYGVQAVIFSGKGAFEYSGSETYANSSHTSLLSCGDCHMAKTMGSGNNMAGGHTWRMTDTTGKENVAGCLKCHSDATSFNINNRQTEIAALIIQLGQKIDAQAGGPYLAKSNGVYTGYSIVDGKTIKKIKIPSSLAAAIINFQLLVRDKSNGVHNYKYTKALINNTIASLK